MIDSGLGWLCDDMFFCGNKTLLEGENLSINLIPYENVVVRKNNNIPCVVGFAVTDNNMRRILYPLLISTEENALSCNYICDETEIEPTVILSGSFSFRGLVWYYKQYEAIEGDIPDFILNYPVIVNGNDNAKKILEDADVVGSSGGFVVYFYYNHSDADHLDKNITNRKKIFGELRNETSIISPVLRIQWSGAFNYNYCYIPIWNRYYYVKDPLSYRNNIIELSLEVDPLMSFKEDILNLNAVINKQESQNINLYLDDGDWVMENKMFNQIYPFSQGFNQNGEFVLIVAGA